LAPLGRPHIPCPYPEHPDENASWRWDKSHRKARCTCAKNDSIFDVVMKIQCINFDDAKVRIAELLNLDYLICVQGEVNGKKFQATDAVRLLNAPADRRDDSLPWIYLGRRLGVDPGRVPRPSTRARQATNVRRMHELVDPDHPTPSLVDLSSNGHRGRGPCRGVRCMQ
jgi:hypothetical protein